MDKVKAFFKGVWVKIKQGGSWVYAKIKGLFCKH